MKKIISFCFLAAFILLVNQPVLAKVKLPAFFTDNMVFQQQTKTAIWGWSTAEKTVKITTSWNNKSYSTKVGSDGLWKIMITTPKYGGPYQIDINDGTLTVLKNVLIGEVWFCSGQSNMEMPLAGWGKINNYQEEIKNADFPNIRLLQVVHQAGKLPVHDVKVTNNGWTTCNPITVADFSSTAYFFAREVYQKTGIPIGLIHSSWGGTVAEAWISGSTLKNNTDFAAEVASIEKSGIAEYGLSEAETIDIWQKAVLRNDLGYQNGKFLFLSKSFDDSQWKTMTMPGLWEKSVLPNFDGIVYLRKKFTIPEAWAGKPLTLNLGALDDQDITYFDDDKIGETLTANTNRVYKISADKVTAGEHTVGIRVYDSGGWGGSPSDSKMLNISLNQEQVVSLAGDWKYKVAMNLLDVGPSPQVSLNVNRPTLLYNTMVHPFLQFAIKGVIWYQGESNALRAHQYRTLFPSLIADWRAKWNIGNFPFYFVQLANFKAIEKEPIASDWAELRDAQKGTLNMVNTGMAVTIDIGNDKDIHPKNKQDVGKRLAFIALAKTYHQPVAYEGPVMEKVTLANGLVKVTFRNAEGGLTSKKDGKGFAIAGADGKFYWADAKIKGNSVSLSSTSVPNPIWVRYAWANNPEATIFNRAGLPAGPFRTDNLKDSTEK
jgi:sialate O-acetylesterase